MQSLQSVSQTILSN